MIHSYKFQPVDFGSFGSPLNVNDYVYCKILQSGDGATPMFTDSVAVHYKGKVYSGVATTAVYFRDMTDREIEDYVASGDPMDKAGSYGIQSGGGKFVEKIEGDYDTVVGLSVALTRRLIDEATK